MKLKLHRDNVVSVVRGKNLVGVYVIAPEDTVCYLEGAKIRIPARAEILLAEMLPDKADSIINLWNSDA